MKVLGMGNALVDVLIHVHDESILEELRLPKGSMQLVDDERLHEIEKRTEGMNRVLVAGGSAANTICGLAELGIEAGFIGSAGNDNWGDFYIHDLESVGVRPLFYRPDKPTGRAMALLTPDSERTFGTYLGAAIELTPAFLTPGLFRGWTVFHIEGYLVQNRDLIRTALDMARAAGCMVSLDLASYNVVEDNLDFLQAILPGHVDILFANQEEALAYTGKEPEEAVAVIAGQCSIAIVKTGKDGAWVQSGSDRWHVPGLPANCIDTTGAGDLFAAGFLFGYNRGYTLQRCGELGNLLASTVIEVTGPKIPEERWPGLRMEAVRI